MRFLRSFHETFHRTVDYYAQIDKKLAQRSIDEVDRAQRDIMQFPKIGRPIKNGREYVLKVFPFGFCYIEDLAGEPVAVRLFHYKQEGPSLGNAIR